MRNWIKKMLCRIGWHSLNYEIIHYDGRETHVRCKWCGYEGVLSSEGNIL
jgi:hypothetical protein